MIRPGCGTVLFAVDSVGGDESDEDVIDIRFSIFRLHVENVALQGLAGLDLSFRQDYTLLIYELLRNEFCAPWSLSSRASFSIV